MLKIFSANVDWKLPAFFLAASVLALGGALVSQFGFGLHPCEMCLYQRVPYAAVILLTLPLLYYRRIANPGIALFLFGLIFLVGAGIAFYHTGLEYKWWEGSGGCSGGGTPEAMEDLRALVMDAPAVRCDEAAFRFIGLSMAGWNVLYSLALSLIAFGWMLCLKKNKN